MNKTKGLDFIKRYTMILVLIVVTAFFAWRTGGAILLPMNVSSLISQNAYVFILATGMLLCILTGGNIDLSVGSVVCFVGAIGAVLMVNMKMNMWLAIVCYRYTDRCFPGFLDRLCENPSVHRDIGRHAGFSRIKQRSPAGYDRIH